jgi:hypothetical protein
MEDANEKTPRTARLENCPNKNQPEPGLAENRGLWFRRLITKFEVNKQSELIPAVEKS